MNSNYLKESSVQLVEIDKQNKPVNLASGCLVDFMKKRFLLTVAHATGNQGNWAIELDYDKQYGARLFQLGGMNFVLKIVLPDGSQETVDFSYAEIPEDLSAFRHYLTPQGETISKDPVHVYSNTLDFVPSKSDKYGFAGCVFAEIAPNPFSTSRPHLIRELRCYDNLVFDREEGDFLVFKLPFNHPGHKHFKGCSGAPVLDTRNNPVGLVCNGIIERDEIFAISLSKMRVALEATIHTSTDSSKS